MNESELNCESLSSFEGISLQLNKLSGNDGEEATPVPMPNTEVKLFSADGSWGFPPVRVGRCQVKSKKISRNAGLFRLSVFNNIAVNLD